jgi:hypothetical protein
LRHLEYDARGDVVVIHDKMIQAKAYGMIYIVRIEG